MMVNLQTVIASAQRLSAVEQVELIRAVSRFLSQQYRTKGDISTAFWQSHTLEEVLQARQPQPVQDISRLKGDFWPTHETADDFIGYIYEQRQDDALYTR